LEKAKELAFRAVDSVQHGVASVHAGAKKLAIKAQILSKRNHIRDLKREWGVEMFDAMENQDKDQIQVAYSVLLKKIEAIHGEIHILERNLLALEKPQDSLEWKKMIIVADSPDQKIQCMRCNQLITGESVVCGNNEYYFHPDCFNCSSCGAQFGSAQVLFYDKKPICEACGDKLVRELVDYDEKDLLQWCEEHLAGFNGVQNITAFTSWYSGLGFAALVANWRPNLLDWPSVRNPDMTAITAFNAAYKAGVIMILDVEFLKEVDKQSLLTQLHLFRRHFALEIPNPEGKREWNEIMGPTLGVESGTLSQDLRNPSQDVTTVHQPSQNITSKDVPVTTSKDTAGPARLDQSQLGQSQGDQSKSQLTNQQTKQTPAQGSQGQDTIASPTK